MKEEEKENFDYLIEKIDLIYFRYMKDIGLLADDYTRLYFHICFFRNMEDFFERLNEDGK